MGAVIEIRTYRTVPKARDRVLDALRTRSFPAQRALGMKVLGPFPATEDETAFVWLRAFPDAARRGTMTDAFYGGALWRHELEPQLMSLIAGYEAIAVDDAIGLWASWPPPPDMRAPG